MSGCEVSERFHVHAPVFDHFSPIPFFKSDIFFQNLPSYVVEMTHPFPAVLCAISSSAYVRGGTTSQRKKTSHFCE